MKLVNLLHYDSVVNTPVVDPSLFMERFAARLNLGNQTSMVAATAVRGTIMMYFK
jgi:transcription factor IIIB 90 kDa subunit